jgi:hypothetical protein
MFIIITIIVFSLYILVAPFFIFVIFLREFEKQVRSTAKLPHVIVKFNTLLDSLRTGIF